MNTTRISTDAQEIQIAATEKGTNMVVPLLVQNKPPIVEGKEDSELADVDLRPEQVSNS